MARRPARHTPSIDARPMLTRSGALLLLCATILGGARAASAAQDAADLVLRHGTFYPVSRPGAVSGSLAVRGGRIAYLGDDAGVQPFIGPRTRIVELGGRTVLPGLIDAHSHLVGL